LARYASGEHAVQGWYGWCDMASGRPVAQGITICSICLVVRGIMVRKEGWRVGKRFSVAVGAVSSSTELAVRRVGGWVKGFRWLLAR
jgi:hypothetical protein